MIYHTQGREVQDEPYALDDLEKAVRAAAQDIRPHLDEFDAIVATGMSGVLVASPLALRLRKPLVVLRKNTDDTHQYSGRGVSISGAEPTKWLGLKHVAGQRLLWVDDFVHSGATRARISAAVAANDGQVVGEYLYQQRELTFGLRPLPPAAPPMVLPLSEIFGTPYTTTGLA